MGKEDTEKFTIELPVYSEHECRSRFGFKLGALSWGVSRMVISQIKDEIRKGSENNHEIIEYLYSVLEDPVFVVAGYIDRHFSNAIEARKVIEQNIGSLIILFPKDRRSEVIWKMLAVYEKEVDEKRNYNTEVELGNDPNTLKILF
jgi:hypothetical protein